MENKQKGTNLEDIPSLLSDDIDTDDELSYLKIRLDGLEMITNCEDYNNILRDLISYEEKNKDKPTDSSEKIIAKAKRLIRQFKLTLEMARLNNTNTKLKVSISNDSLIELLKLDKVTSWEIYNRCEETLNLLEILDELTRDELENRVINHLTKLNVEFRKNVKPTVKNLDDILGWD